MERMYFFDSTEEDERIYSAADLARFHNQIIGNGVSNDPNLPNLEVTSESNMDVSLGAGFMFANGYMYQNTDGLTLTHDTADANNDRIDRIVIKFDANPEERTINAYVKKGTPSSNPNPPSLTRDNYVYEMSVAQVRIIKGKSFIEQSEIIDERSNDAVCGYIPLHNIYRGMEVNELGMVTLPNQSYVEMNKTSSFSLSGDGDFDQSSNYYKQYIDIVPLIDRQDEIDDGKFKIKADGTYLFTSHIRVLDGQDFDVNKKIEAYMVINGQTAINDRLYLYNGYLNESQYYGSNIRFLQKGDVVRLVMARRFANPVNLDYLRLNIAKIN